VNVTGAAVNFYTAWKFETNFLQSMELLKKVFTEHGNVEERF
jgi:hypothetical protein